MAKRATPASKPAAPDIPAIGPPGRAPASEVGVTGLRSWNGYIDEEFANELRGSQGRAVYKEMTDNDATVGGMLAAIGLILRAAKWRVEPAKDVDDTDKAQEAADFIKGCIDDMSHPFEDFVAEAISMLSYGWAYHEICYKQRVGPNEVDPTKRSKFDDYRIGWRKLPIRSQDSLLRWEMQEDGGIDGMVQQRPDGGPEIFLPIEKSLLVRTTSRKNSPEGVSVLRNAYRPWHLLKKIQNIEAIGIERDLSGLPVVSIPGRYLSSTNAADIAIRNSYAALARDLRFNTQGSLTIPSDTFPNKDGSPSAIRMVEINLLASPGQRSLDSKGIKMDYQRDIARSVLADFLILGSDKGAFNLAEAKTSLFMKAAETYLGRIVSPFNMFAIPRLWDLNGFDRAYMPQLGYGPLAPADLVQLGDFIQKISGAGATVFPDEPLEDHLREAADLPPKTAEVLDMQEEIRETEDERAGMQAEAAAARAAGMGQKPPPKKVAKRRK